MIDFTNRTVYIYLIISVGIIVIIVYGIKYILLWRNKRDTSDSVSNQLTKKELIAMVKELKNQKKGKVNKIEAKLVASKKVKKEQEIPEDTYQKKFKLLKTNSKLSFAFWKNWYLEKYHPGRIVLINMELTNGFHRLFVVKEKEDGFVFRGKKYVFDDDSKYYNLDTKLYTFDYHEQIALPFKRKVPVTEIKKTIESTEGIDIEYAINPSTLQRFMTAKIAEGVMKGTQLDEFMKKMQMFLIVTMVAVLVHLAIFLYASGILQNLKVPGILG